MFGADLNPTVTTERVGFGSGFGRAREGVLCIVQRVSDGRTTKERLVSKGQRRQQGEAGTTNGPRVYENMRMQCV